MAIMIRGLFQHSMQIVDLRQIQSRTLDPLFQEEARHWRDELYWDYRPSIDLIRKFIDSRSLGGYVATENGSPAGYGFYVLEDHKGLIGGLFVSSNFTQDPITKSLVTEMVAALHATPRLERVEAQLMPFGAELPPLYAYAEADRAEGGLAGVSRELPHGPFHHAYHQRRHPHDDERRVSARDGVRITSGTG